MGNTDWHRAVADLAEGHRTSAIIRTDRDWQHVPVGDSWVTDRLHHP